MRLTAVPLIIAFALLGPASAGAQAMHGAMSPIHVGQPWARASAGQTGAAYMTLKNEGPADDKLVSASSPVATKTELHSMTMEGDVMKMRPVEDIPVKSHGSAELKPGGLHIMLMGLKAPLKQGDKIVLTLKFEKAGEMTVEVPVQAAGAGAPAMGGMDHGHGH
jgi:copper(I)-binding protein